MTHDELVEQLDFAVNGIGDKYAYMRQGWVALRAVVELHEPGDYGHDSWQACLHCSCQDCHTFIVYPCSTIQTIEKGL
jgi:hypothetical protein